MRVQTVLVVCVVLQREKYLAGKVLVVENLTPLQYRGESAGRGVALPAIELLAGFVVPGLQLARGAPCGGDCSAAVGDRGALGYDNLCRVSPAGLGIAGGMVLRDSGPHVERAAAR